MKHLLFTVLVCMATQHVLGQDEPTDLELQVRSITEQLNSWQNWMDESSHEVKELEESLRLADEEIAEASRHLHDLGTNISQIQERINAEEARQAEIGVLVDELKDSINWHVNVAYRIQRTHWLRLILEPQNLDKKDRLLRYSDYFLKSKTVAIGQLNKLNGELDDLVESMNQDQQELTRKQTEWQTKRHRLDESNQARTLQMESLNQEISIGQLEIKKLTEDRQRIESLLEEIESATSTIPFELEDSNQLATKGNMAWPVEGQLLRKFGDSRADGRLNWKGIYIAADEGTNVVAVAPGKVVFADWFRGYGMMLVIDHGDDVKTIYGNCDSLLLRLGEHVEAGEPMAIVGQSGGQPRTGLYFEVRKSGESEDPVEWLEDRDSD